MPLCSALAGTMSAMDPTTPADTTVPNRPHDAEKRIREHMEQSEMHIIYAVPRGDSDDTVFQVHHVVCDKAPKEFTGYAHMNTSNVYDIIGFLFSRSLSLLGPNPDPDTVFKVNNKAIQSALDLTCTCAKSVRDTIRER